HAYFLERHPHKIPNGSCNTRCNHEVFGLILLEDEPHGLYVVMSMTPVALGVQVTQVQLFLQPQRYLGHGARNLTGYESLAPERGLVVRSEEHTSELQSRENLVCRLLLAKKRPLMAAYARVSRFRR